MYFTFIAVVVIATAEYSPGPVTVNNVLLMLSQTESRIAMT